MKPLNPEWLDTLAAVFPPSGLLLVGAGSGQGVLAQWLARQPAPAVLVEADAERFALLRLALGGHRHLAFEREVVAPSTEAVVFHRYSVADENGLLPPHVFKTVWPHMGLIDATPVTDPLTIDGLLGAISPSPNWLLIDIAASHTLLQGASQALASCDVLIFRLHSDAVEASLVQFTQMGFHSVGRLPTRHPSIHYLVCVRSMAAQRAYVAELHQQYAQTQTELERKLQVETQARQQEAAAKAEALQQRDELAQAKAELTHVQAELQHKLQAEALARQQEAAAKAEALQQRDELSELLTDVKPSLASFPHILAIDTQIEWGPSFPLCMNTNRPECIDSSSSRVDFEIESGEPVYLVSTCDGQFTHPGNIQQLPVDPGVHYILSGCIAFEAFAAPHVWIFQFDGSRRVHADPMALPQDGKFRFRFKSTRESLSIAIGLRLSGKGYIDTKHSRLRLREDPYPEALEVLERKLAKIEKHQSHEVKNAVRQIESFVRLQQYLGPDVLVPEMHNWTISPDFAVLLIQLIEQHSYDAVIEFGSGSSTVILAKALSNVAERKNLTPAPLLSFDHLPQYQRQTQQALGQLGLQSSNNQVILAPLMPWQAPSGSTFSYYECTEALNQLRQVLSIDRPKLLIVVDGPPAATGQLARYPAMAKVMASFQKPCELHFLLDDFLREEEQKIVQMWVTELSELQFSVKVTTHDQLEKKACFIEVS